jgi:hypothetical protein
MIRNRPAAHIIQLLLPVIVVVLAAPLAVPVGASLSVQEQTVTIMAAGDISPDPGAAKDDDIATSNLILDADPTTVLTLGDNQYPQGQLADYQNRAGYQGSWGRFKAKTRPSPGNHDYADPAGGAAGYFGYFGALAGDPDKGYYSFDLGAWHIIALNSNCGAGGRPAGQRQAVHPGLLASPPFHRPGRAWGRATNPVLLERSVRRPRRLGPQRPQPCLSTLRPTAPARSTRRLRRRRPRDRGWYRRQQPVHLLHAAPGELPLPRRQPLRRGKAHLSPNVLVDGISPHRRPDRRPSHSRLLAIAGQRNRSTRTQIISTSLDCRLPATPSTTHARLDRHSSLANVETVWRAIAASAPTDR